MDQALTFYIASHGENIEEVQRLAGLLQECGYEWHEGWDWTRSYMYENRLSTAILDKICARDADIFIFLQYREFSTGANREWGVRWGTDCSIVNIGDESHLFDQDPRVTQFPTIEAFLEIL